MLWIFSPSSCGASSRLGICPLGVVVPALGSLARFVSVVALAAVLSGFELSLGVQAWTRGCLALGLALSARLAVTTSSWLLFCASGRVCFASACDWVLGMPKTYGLVDTTSMPPALARRTFTRP